MGHLPHTTPMICVVFGAFCLLPVHTCTQLLWQQQMCCTQAPSLLPPHLAISHSPPPQISGPAEWESLPPLLSLPASPPSLGRTLTSHHSHSPCFLTTSETCFCDMHTWQLTGKRRGRSWGRRGEAWPVGTDDMALFFTPSFPFLSHPTTFSLSLQVGVMPTCHLPPETCPFSLPFPPSCSLLSLFYFSLSLPLPLPGWTHTCSCFGGVCMCLCLGWLPMCIDFETMVWTAFAPPRLLPLGPTHTVSGMSLLISSVSLSPSLLFSSLLTYMDLEMDLVAWPLPWVGRGVKEKVWIGQDNGLGWPSIPWPSPFLAFLGWSALLALCLCPTPPT